MPERKKTSAREPTKKELEGTTAEEKEPVPEADDRSAEKRREFLKNAQKAEGTMSEEGA